MKKLSEILFDNSQPVLELKFSLYFNRRVFVMNAIQLLASI